LAKARRSVAEMLYVVNNRYCRLSGCAALDNTIEGVVVINVPDDRN
jgi:hypothetical protein